VNKEQIATSRFVRVIHPMPTFLVTCVGHDARPNAVAIAWLTPVSIDPPLLAFAIREERHSYRLLQENPAFVVNAMAYSHTPEVLLCGRHSGRDVDKFAATGLTAVAAAEVDAPAIAEALAHVECQVEAEYPAGDHILVVGRVRAVSAKSDVLVEGWRDLAAAPPILHLGGAQFTTSSFAVIQPDVEEA
jgi:flavin reductase (DIM6/NTAB) family NADH-FMN oxidoreductase RutF